MNQFLQYPCLREQIYCYIDRVNEYGLVAVPVILWALQNGAGRELSPGNYLSDDQAILLARYIVARYGGNHVIWALGGDGIYTGIYEQRWKTIGRAVFNANHQGVVAPHPCGRSWIGEIYKDEPWLDVIDIRVWWNMFPAQDLLINQPGDEKFNHFVSLVKTTDNNTLLAYLPAKLEIKIRKPVTGGYKVRWFDPVNNKYSDGSVKDEGQVLTITSPSDGDMILILTKVR